MQWLLQARLFVISSINFKLIVTSITEKCPVKIGQLGVYEVKEKSTQHCWLFV